MPRVATRRGRIAGGVRRGALLLGVIGATLFVARAYQTQSGPPLEPWHTYVPAELGAGALDAADWTAYLAAEDRALAAVEAEVTRKLPAAARVSYNRYFAGSPVHPAGFAHDWNRSFVMEPDGPAAGAVVLLHGLTDSPYSGRAIAERYRARGFVAIGIRLPAHGTVPAALTAVEWEDWMAATRLAVREAVRRTGGARALHLVGYSNGGALAMKYALDAAEDDRLPRPDRVVLLSPMIGITRFARFAGLAAWPAVLPRFAKAAWLSRVPEFNPFKYNSFPVNAGRQSHRLTAALQAQIARLARDDRLRGLAPVVTFQSVVDFTVSTPAIFSALYANLPANGSELVLFDVNRTVKFGPLLAPSVDAAIERLLPPLPQAYRITTIANAPEGGTATVERTIEPGETAARVRPLALPYPPAVFSLSHVAVPFPMNDPLYGMTPDPGTGTEFGISLGTLGARGERGALVVDLDFLMRMNCNPFLPYVLDRIEEGTGQPAGSSAPSPPAVVAGPSVAPPRDTFGDDVQQPLADP